MIPAYKDWICDYCRQNDHPMQHGCSAYWLKQEIDRLKSEKETMYPILAKCGAMASHTYILLSRYWAEVTCKDCLKKRKQFMKRLLGYLILSIPFIVLMGYIINEVGWMMVLEIWGIFVLTLACIVLGTFLATSD